MSVHNVASQDDLDWLLLLAPKSLKKLAISINSARPFPTHDTYLDQYAQLESFSYLGGHSVIPKFLVLPPLRELELTSSFSFISMINASQLERLSIKPARLSTLPWSSAFCSEMDALLSLLIMAGSLAPGDITLSITLPRYLDDHLHQVSANGLNCTCLHKLYQLTTMNAVTTLSFKVHKCNEIVHEHILEWMEAFPCVRRLFIIPESAEDSECRSLHTFITSIQGRLPHMFTITHGQETLCCGDWDPIPVSV
ncbi:hypothetical protein EST38_g12028 [Candolleomyces aberdarensis]|uniref:Uncharacterized protein n=1 Tax=Candolleomyces aberdarensis TaxID=2316362 RepID=A0A4Q2D4Y7_9AGAR|nr:hypothetical protein EST38_g12028 [Candolleomyces aberdarensis]